VRAGGEIVGTLTDAAMERRAVARARERLQAGHRDGAERIDAAELFFQTSGPPPELVIFGAGHDAVPVARLAWAIGFAVTVVDVRDGFLAADRFPGATLVRAHFTELGQKVT